MPEWKHFTFERDKFRQLILYFSKRGADEGLVIGSTKLNKLLFFTDFRAYAELGAPITGARYQRLEHGPAARAMLPVRNEMVEELHEAHFEERPADDLNDVLVADRDPDLTLFSEDELRIAEAVFDELRKFNARGVSDYAHYRSAGWRVMADGEDIPYESALCSTDPAPPEAIEMGRQLAALYEH
jgi:Antitoxin SocA-like, Panacea domain